MVQVIFVLLLIDNRLRVYDVLIYYLLELLMGLLSRIIKLFVLGIDKPLIKVIYLKIVYLLTQSLQYLLSILQFNPLIVYISYFFPPSEVVVNCHFFVHSENVRFYQRLNFEVGRFYALGFVFCFLSGVGPPSPRGHLIVVSSWFFNGYFCQGIFYLAHII